MANVDLAAFAGNYSGVNRGCEIPGRYLGMWNNEDDNKGASNDFVPLEERLAYYLEQETIDAADNVQRLPHCLTDDDGHGAC